MNTFTQTAVKKKAWLFVDTFYNKGVPPQGSHYCFLMTLLSEAPPLQNENVPSLIES